MATDTGISGELHQQQTSW